MKGIEAMPLECLREHAAGSLRRNQANTARRNCQKKAAPVDAAALTATALTATIIAEAHRLGFDLVRVAPVAEAPHADFFDGWIARGRAGEMTYLARNREKRRHPARLAEHEPFRAMIVLGVDYHQLTLAPDLLADPSRGIIASYAWGDDYHELIRPRLHELDAFVGRQSGRTTPGKCLVDTGPVLERDWAMRSGLGFTGKNCCTIRPGMGSWILLATILVPEVLTPSPGPLLSVDVHNVPTTPATLLDGAPPAGHYGRWQLDEDEAAAPSRTGTCGACTRCLVACPTDAFVGPFHLDPQRCISYWTIEARGPIPRDLRARFQNRIFGCDICQEVCPWNGRLPQRQAVLPGLAARQERMAPPLLDGFHPSSPYWLEQQAFSEHFRRSPIKRAKRRGMLRNVCVALGNWADHQAEAALLLALADPEPLARGHAAWALGQLLRAGTAIHSHRRLEDALSTEVDQWVASEIHAALSG